MKKFIYELLKFLLPFIIIIIIVTYIDFFKIWGFQDDYYEENKVGINREMICTKTYNHYRKAEQFNSFILGSSRSQAYKCEKWKIYLDNKSKLFHFDASGEGIWGISKKIEYIDRLGDTIKNALLVLDRTILKTTKMKDGHLFIPMPEVSKSSRTKYYSTFLKSSLNPKFIIAYLDYSVFKKHRAYMGYLISRSKYKNTANYQNCDLWYGYDKYIKNDSVGYYQKQIDKGNFYKRPREKEWECEITNLEIEQLKSIKKIFQKHNTKYKIVISPIYDQIVIEKDQIELLHQMFGKDNVYDFSGRNRYTEKISNYYDKSHYRPIVANDIMKKIYAN